jgi:GNAT superfamily N-acetyltransferase
LTGVRNLAARQRLFHELSLVATDRERQIRARSDTDLAVRWHAAAHQTDVWRRGRDCGQLAVMGEATPPAELCSRLATIDDVPRLRELMNEAIAVLQSPYLTPEQVASSRAIMGLDLQLIHDGTYFIIECDGEIAGCGGWSRRATLYGKDDTPRRDAALLDPKTQPAKVRAMYTDPRFTRRGVGRLILSLCESAAAEEGYHELELMATLSGHPLYRSFGFTDVEEVTDDTGGTPVPLVRMRKPVET